MATIQFSAAAAADIISRLASGELEVHGLLLRNASGKRFRYILRGLEELPTEAGRLPDLPELGPLRAAMSMQQVIGLIGMAQNAALAATLKRIAGRLDRMQQQLSALDARLARVELKASLSLEGQYAMPMGQLKAACNKALNARRDGDRAGLTDAAKDAETAARNLLAFAGNMVRVGQDGVPAALVAPADVASLAGRAGLAMAAASSMQVALGSTDIAACTMHEVAEAVAHMRARLARHAADPDALLRRMSPLQAPDVDLLAAAEVLRETQQWTQSRAVMIEMGLIQSGRHKAELEWSPQPASLAFEEIDADRVAPSHASASDDLAAD